MPFHLHTAIKSGQATGQQHITDDSNYNSTDVARQTVLPESCFLLLFLTVLFNPLSEITDRTHSRLLGTN